MTDQLGADRTNEEYLLKLVAGLKSDDYVKQRLFMKIDRYKQLGGRHRRYFYVFSSVAIVSAALVPVLITLDTQSWIPITLSLAVTISVSVESLFHFREHWRNYDNAEESLRRQEFLFGTRSGLYEGKNDQEAFRLLVSKVEEIVQTERQDTIQMRTADHGATELADRVKTEIKAIKGKLV